MKQVRLLMILFFAASMAAEGSGAQTAVDPSVRLRQVLPADVAQRVLARIATARAHQLPADALENRALKFAAKGVAPQDIERSVFEQADRMGAARNAIASSRSQIRGDEIEAGAEAMRKGVSGPAVSLLAKRAPPQRSLAVPLFVIGSLTDRGLSSNEALERVLERLEWNATDADLERMPGEVAPRTGGGNAYGRDKARPDNAGSQKPKTGGRPVTGRPAGVPGNAGNRAKPKKNPGT
jgi:hypothetical protein